MCTLGDLTPKYPPALAAAAKAEVYAEFMTALATKARGVVWDLDPKNELRYLRVRAKHAEILVAIDEDFIVVIIQRWTPAG